MYIKRIIIAVVLLGLVGTGIFAYSVYTTFLSPNTVFNNEEAHLFVPTDASYQYVRTELKPLLKDIEAFDDVAVRKHYTENVKSGHFLIKKGSNNNEIVNAIRSGNVPIKIAFNNQERIEDLAGRVSEQLEADSLSLLETMRDTSFLRKQGLDLKTALNLYLPNTYEFYWDTDATEFRERMAEEYNRFWTKERVALAEKQGLTPVQAYNLASIVQKETAMTEERPRVAGVYLNRFQNGWKLDADPTVIYALKKEQNDFDQVIKRVLYKDLTLDSPYNTYKYAGIPPGPISMPDLSAINAVLHPEDHKYYYFVADVSNPGYHLFAKSLREHNNNRQQYINWINKQGVNR